ncbi:unnamed protein product, partial [Polarella glacialis]
NAALRRRAASTDAFLLPWSRGLANNSHSNSNNINNNNINNNINNSNNNSNNNRNSNTNNNINNNNNIWELPLAPQPTGCAATSRL